MDRELAAWVESLQARRLADGTVAGYQSDVRGGLEFCAARGADGLEQIDVAMLRAWLASLRHLSARTVNRRQASAKAFFRWCAEEGLLLVNPAARLRSVKVSRPKTRFLTVGQMASLLAAIDTGQPFRWRDRALVMWFATTGCRISEAFDLELHDLRRDDLSATVVGKGGKPRAVFFTPETGAALGSWLTVREEHLRSRGLPDPGLVFLSRGGRRIDPATWNQTLKRYARIAGVPTWLSTHKLRHSFATALLEHGANLRDVQELLGHASVESTQRYTHVTGGRKREAHRLLPPLG